MSGADTVAGWAESLRIFGNEWPPEGADACAEYINRQVILDTGGDSRLSNHRGGEIDIEVEGAGTEWTIVPAGNVSALSILESGTSDHAIYSRRGPGRAVMTPDGPRRMVEVSGVSARNTWTKGAEAGIKEAEKVAEQMFGEVS